MTRAPLTLGFLFALGGLSCLKSDFPPADDPVWKCDQDRVCDPDENQVVCPDDCVWSEATGEGPAAAVCDAQENWTFVQACLDTCGNGQEDDGETAETCPRDFPGPGCGDGVCGVDEDPAHCPTECHPGSCGNGACEAHENAGVCAEDCAGSCGDDICQAGEETNCPKDCESCEGDSCVCGDMICGTGESTVSCPEDCTTPSCGNGVVEEGEACDDGNGADGDMCTNACTTAVCGDGLIWAGQEACDDGNAADDDACRNSCDAAVCGDGVVWVGEEACDDGNQVDTDDCTNACEAATCGDGVVWADQEVCDDGNQVDTDDCTNACEAATCGDGVVWAGQEECDDANQVDADACTNACKKPRRVIFVTSAEFKGDLGGMSGADAKCVAAAMSAGLTNASTFKAWLSDGATWPSMRLDTAYLGMYVLVDGTPVAENGWADLTDGTLAHPVDKSEAGMTVDSAPWTSTKADGTSVGANHCNFWTNSQAINSGRHGFTSVTDASWTDAMATIPCSAPAPLYCIEDP